MNFEDLSVLFVLLALVLWDITVFFNPELTGLVVACPVNKEVTFLKEIVLWGQASVECSDSFGSHGYLLTLFNFVCLSSFLHDQGLTNLGVVLVVRKDVLWISLETDGAGLLVEEENTSIVWLLVSKLKHETITFGLFRHIDVVFWVGFVPETEKLLLSIVEVISVLVFVGITLDKFVVFGCILIDVQILFILKVIFKSLLLLDKTLELRSFS